MRKFGNVERNSHCDVLHFTPVRVARLILDCNGFFAIKAYKPMTTIQIWWQRELTTCYVSKSIMNCDTKNKVYRN